jgi:hypothetical protein
MRNIFSILRIFGILKEIIGVLSVYTIKDAKIKITIENTICRFCEDNGLLIPNKGSNVFIKRPHRRSKIMLSPIEYKKFSYLSITFILKRRFNKPPGIIKSAINPDIGRITGILNTSEKLKINKKQKI